MFDFGIVQVRPLSYALEIAEVILESRNEDNVSVRRVVDHYPDGSLGFPIRVTPSTEEMCYHQHPLKPAGVSIASHPKSEPCSLAALSDRSPTSWKEAERRQGEKARG